MNETNHQRWLTYKQAAAYLNCSDRHLQKLDIPRSKFPGSRTVRFDVKDLDAFCEEAKIPTKGLDWGAWETGNYDQAGEPTEAELQEWATPSYEEAVGTMWLAMEEINIVIDPTTLAPADEHSREAMRTYLEGRQAVRVNLISAKNGVVKDGQS